MQILATLFIVWTLTNATLIVVFRHYAAGGTAQTATDRFSVAQAWTLTGRKIEQLAQRTSLILALQFQNSIQAYPK